MSLFKKRVLILFIVLTAILTAAVALFYRPTRLALERAEAFQFRRMQVPQINDQGTYRFFFATNRVLTDEADTNMEERFSNRHQQSLVLGSFDTMIEPTLGFGMLINPTDWFQNEQIKLKDIQILPEDNFVMQLREQVERAPFKSVLININGFRERFPSALRKTTFLSHVLDIDSPVVVFDWPGNQGSSPRGYRRAQSVASESGAELAELIRLVAEQVQPEKIWLVANSMGAQVVVHGFSTLYQSRALNDSGTRIDNVVLTAPDVDKNQFNEQFKEQIKALSENLTVYVSSNDRALLMSRVLNRGRRLGESTLRPGNPDQFDEAEDIYQLIEPGDTLWKLIDVTPINRTRNFHNFSLETPEFFDDLYLRLVNDGTIRSRPEYRIEVPDGREYWILTQGR